MADAWELNTIARDSNFQKRVVTFMANAAVKVMSESSQTPGYQERTNYAQSVLRDETTTIQVDPSTTSTASPADPLRHGQAALSNPTVAANADLTQPTRGYYNIDDADLEFAVEEVWNAMSGVATG